MKNNPGSTQQKEGLRIETADAHSGINTVAGYDRFDLNFEQSGSPMEARPLPIQKIVITFIALAMVSLVAQFFGIRQLHGIGLIVAFLAIAFTLGYHAWVDNMRTTYRNFQSWPTFGLAVVVWSPFIILLMPGIVATLYIDDRLDAALRFAETTAAGTIETIEEQFEDTIQESEAIPWRWWWPPDYVQEGTRIVERKVMRTVQRDVLHPAPLWIRGLFAFVYALMRISQLVLYTTLSFIAIRSFVFLLARCALWRRSEIEFTLP